MENRLNFFKNRDDYLPPKKNVSSSNSLECDIKKLSDKLADSFLKDKVFFDVLEKSLLASLGNFGNSKISHYNSAKKSIPLPLLNESLSNSKNSYISFNNYNDLDDNSASHIIDEDDKMFTSEFDKNNFPIANSVLETKVNVGYKPLNASLDKDLQPAPSFIKNEIEINDADLDSGIHNDFVNELDNCLEKSFKADYDQYIKCKKDKEPVLNDELSESFNDRAVHNFSGALNKFGTVASFKKGKEEKGVFKDTSQDIVSLNVRSSRSLQTNGLVSSPQIVRELESASDCEINVDDSLELDIEDIEKEIFSVFSPAGGVSNSGKSCLDNQDKVNSINTDENRVIFDFNQIIDFKRSPELLNDDNMPVPPLIDEEEASTDNTNLNFDQVGNAYSFKNASHGIKQDILYSSAQKDEELHVKSDHRPSSENIQIKLSTMENRCDKDQVIIRRIWLILYITILIGLGIYWVVKLHREVESYSGNTHIVTASKDPIQIIPIPSEDDVSANQATEVYDRFKGKNPSSPKQTKLRNSQEMLIDFPEK